MKNIIFLSIIGLILASCTPAGPVSRTIEPAAILLATATQPAVATSQPAVSATPQPTASAAPTATSQASAVQKIPNFDHIVLILLENEYIQDTIGNPQMPHFNALARQNVLLTNYFAVSHPSLPNYLALVSGSTQNITNDCIDCFVNQPNLADEIEASGRTWKSYQESMPSPCFIGEDYPYGQMENPFLYFDSIRLDKSRCDQSIVPLTQLDSDLMVNSLPDFALIMPDLCDSGHDCEAVRADNWLDGMVSKLQASPAFGQNSLIVITFDEGTEHSTAAACCGTSSNYRGQIAALLISPLARQSFTDDSIYTHYSLLKTILEAWNLPVLGQTAKDSIHAIITPWVSQPEE